jgi:hypothetical protein
MRTKLTRLRQENDQFGEINDLSTESLNQGNAPLVHIALVYTHLEGKRRELGPLFQSAILAAFNLTRYGRLTQIIRTLTLDILAMFKPQTQDKRSEESTLRVRTDPGSRHVKGNPTSGFTIFRQLENDVAAYVCHNDERERVRSFVRDVITQLANRTDVAGIVINAHSNGTVVAFDVLRDLPSNVAEKILWFITAGSPLLKYTEIFHWGSEVGSIQKVGKWTNFWDKKDLVADRLDSKGVYQYYDPSGRETHKYSIDDKPVDNVKYSSGSGLRAHNYWDNTDQFIKQLSEGLNDLLVKYPLSYPAAS